MESDEDTFFLLLPTYSLWQILVRENINVSKML